MSIFQNNSTQIITSDILLNEGGYIGENVTLIFQGGMIKINPNLQLLPPNTMWCGSLSKWKKGNILVNMGATPSIVI